MQEAKFYKRLDNLAVACELCRQACLIENNLTGVCQVRKNGLIRNIGFYLNNFVTRNRKNFLSLTPLVNALKPFNFALNDSAEALVLLLIK